uniref:Uncharacterized protein n=1 Tax=Arundo donax TaxID=35708 RepID=A0A0A9DRR8_ARUDO
MPSVTKSSRLVLLVSQSAGPIHSSKSNGRPCPSRVAF